MRESKLKNQLENLRIQVLILSDIAAAPSASDADRAAQVQLIRRNITSSFNDLQDIQTQA